VNLDSLDSFDSRRFRVKITDFGHEILSIDDKIAKSLLKCYELGIKPTQRLIAKEVGVSQATVFRKLPKIKRALGMNVDDDDDEDVLIIVPDIFSDEGTYIVEDVTDIKCPSQIVVQPKTINKKETATEFMDLSPAGQILYTLIPNDKLIELASAEYGKELRLIKNVIDDTEWRKVKLQSGKVIYTTMAMDVRPGMRIIPKKGELWRTTIRGFAIRSISICYDIQVIGYPNHEIYKEIGIDLMSEDFDLDNPTKELLVECKDDKIDYEMAIEGVSPQYVGDNDAKELMMYAECSFDPDYAKDSAVSICVRTRSGGGKTVLLKGIKRGMDFEKIYSVDDLTPAGRGMVRGEEVVVGMQAKKIGIDELNKWETKNIEALLPLVGGEEQDRVRYGMDFEVQNDAWCVATLLTTLDEMEDKRSQKKASALAQFMRRCVQLDLTSEQPGDQVALSALTREQTRRRYTRRHGLTPEQERAVYELRKVRFIAKINRDVMKGSGIDFFFGASAKETKKIDKWIDAHCSHYALEFYGASANWSPEMQRMIRNLSIGKTLSRKLTLTHIPEKELKALFPDDYEEMDNDFVVVSFDDVKYVAAITEKHAKKLGYWLTTKQLKARKDQKRTDQEQLEVA